MLIGGMARYQVQHHLDALSMSFFHQFDQIVVRTESRIHFIKVNDVVTSVYPA